MTPLAKRVLVIVIAIAVIVPAVYVLNQQSNYVRKQSDPYNFVPSGSNAVLEAHLNGTNLYLFGTNGSMALILPVSVETLQLGLNFTSANGTSATQVHSYTVYRNQQIYSIENISMTTITDIGKYVGGNIFTMFSVIPFNLSGTMYAADSGQVGMVLGNLSAVKESILSSQTGDTFTDSASKYLDGGSNYTFYLSPSNGSGVSYMTGNISDGHSSVYIGLEGNNSLGTFFVQLNSTYNISISSMEHGVRIEISGNYTVGELISYATSFLTMAGL